MTNWFCSDIQVRGEYPYYAQRFFEENGIVVKKEPGDAAILKEGTVDFYTFSWLPEFVGYYGESIKINTISASQRSLARLKTGRGQQGPIVLRMLPLELQQQSKHPSYRASRAFCV